MVVQNHNRRIVDLQLCTPGFLPWLGEGKCRQTFLQNKMSFPSETAKTISRLQASFQEQNSPRLPRRLLLRNQMIPAATLAHLAETALAPVLQDHFLQARHLGEDIPISAGIIDYDTIA